MLSVKKEILLKNSIVLATYLLIVWGFYRMLFKLPEEVEELVVKPVLWLGPVLFLVRREGLGFSSLGISSKNLFPSLYLSLALGMVFAIEGVIVNYIKYQGVEFYANLGSGVFITSLFISFATAFSEEITFRGYIFNRLWNVFGDEWKANLVSSFIWALVHIPVAIFWWELDLYSTLGLLFLTTIFGIGSSYVFARTKNVASSILLHVLWGWPIVLFR